MKKFPAKLLSLALLAVTSGAAFAASEHTPTVQTQNGALRGVVQNQMNAYLGIPYAKPPVGKLRWQPPQAADGWQGTREAVAYGNACPQNADLGVFSKAGGKEDCLTLNVFTPKQTGEKLPVLVWIHGGSLFVGQGADYDPSLLVEQGAVVVTINYRLGLLGFFAHPALMENGKAGINYGLLDQNLALDWVQKNIARFGGDPENVTISGESSGGNSVVAHIVSPQSAGKFQQAIPMSGGALLNRYPFFGGSRTKAEAIETSRGFVEKMCGSEKEVVTCLQNIPVETILAEQTPYLINQPVVDGHFLPLHANDAFKTGRFNKVMVINGTTHDEGTFFAGFPENESGRIMDNAGYLKALEGMHGKEFAQKVYAEFPPEKYITPSEAYAASVTSLLFSCPAQRMNQLISAHTPVYAYVFADQTAPGYLKPTSFPLKAAHTFELPYLFPGFRGNLDNPVVPKLNAMQQILAREMAAIWANPRQALSNRPKWQPFNPEQDNHLQFALPKADIRLGYGENTAQCDFWMKSGLYH